MDREDMDPQLVRLLFLYIIGIVIALLSGAKLADVGLWFVIIHVIYVAIIYISVFAVLSFKGAKCTINPMHCESWENSNGSAKIRILGRTFGWIVAILSIALGTLPYIVSDSENSENSENSDLQKISDKVSGFKHTLLVFGVCMLAISYYSARPKPVKKVALSRQEENSGRVSSSRYSKLKQRTMVREGFKRGNDMQEELDRMIEKLGPRIN
jgi:hypothetical protein